MLDITLLGRPRMRLDGHSLPVKSRKAQALLFYLVTEQRPHSREKLASWFWEETEPDRARNNLSGILSKDLRPLRDKYLMAMPDSIGFNIDAEHQVDVHRLRDRFRLQNASLRTYEELTQLYQGQFLVDFTLPTAPEFEYWRNGQQERYHSLAYPIFNTLIWHHHREENWNQGIQLAQRLLNARPTDEKARRLLMLLLVLNDQRVVAMEHYETYYDMLNNEGNQPAAETTVLYRAIMQDSLDENLIDNYTQPRYTPSATTVTIEDNSAPFQPERQVPHFVGREEELVEIVSAITDTEASNIICLVGMGGIGKTTLAVKLAHELRGDFPDGVLWAKLAVSDPFSVLESWAQAYNLDYSQLADLESRAAAFRDFLEDKQTLLILDDVRRSSQVKPLLPNGEGCTVLITTRDAAIANLFNAQAIQLPVFEHQTSLDLLAALLTPERVNNELEAATEIADLLEHLPLALEITAKRLRSRPWSLAQTADRLRSVKSRLNELTLRDIAVRATFEDSWAILDEAQQRFFAYLAVFGEREFQMDALRHITELDNFTTEDILFDLAELSLVFTDGEWFWLHSLLADFAGEKLEERDEIDETRQRMAGYYLDFVIEHQRDMPILNEHWLNIIAGVQAAYDSQMWQACIEYAENLYDAFFTQGHYTDARAIYAIALEATRALDEQETLVDLLCLLARACIEQSDYDEARTYLDQSLAISQHLEYPKGIGESLLKIGWLTLRQVKEKSDFEEAQKHLQQSREIFEELDNQSKAAEALVLEAEVPLYLRDYVETIALLKQALIYYDETDDASGSAKAHNMIANIYLSQGKFELAQRHCDIAYDLCLVTQNIRELSTTLYIQAEIHKAFDNLSQAIKTIDESILLLQKTGNRRVFGQALARKAIIHSRMTEYSLAVTELFQCLMIFESIEDHQGIARIHFMLGETFSKMNSVSKACEHWKLAKQYLFSKSWLIFELDKRLDENSCLHLV